MKKLATIVVFMTLVINANAQQEAMYTHYAFNMLSVNPAYAGSREAMTLTALHRSQWVGFEGAPQTESFTIHSPIAKNNMGLGLSFINDKIGPINNTGFQGCYAYKLKFNYGGKLALGINGGVNLLQADLTGLQAANQNDVTLTNTRNQVMPNFGFGAYYTYTKFFAGFSIPSLIKNKLDPTSPTGLNLEERHTYITGGVNLDVTKNIAFKPIALIKMVKGAPLQTDLTGLIIINKTVEIGGMYRSGDAYGLIVGYNLPNHIRVGYSFDWSMGVKTARVNSGSHELILRYDFISKARKRIVSPRYF